MPPSQWIIFSMVQDDCSSAQIYLYPHHDCYMKKALFIVLTALVSLTVPASPPGQYHLMIAPGTLTDHSVTLLWDKQYEGKNNPRYEITLNGKSYTTTAKTNCTIGNLTAANNYVITVRTKGSKAAATVSFKTAGKGKIYNILDYGAKNDTAINNTHAIQAAINACA